MNQMRLLWLPIDPDWRARLKSVREHGKADPETWSKLVAIANTQLDFTGINALDVTSKALFAEAPPNVNAPPIKLAVLSSSTCVPLLPAIRVAGMRRGIWIDIYEGTFGQYLQELYDNSSGLRAFFPDVILFSFDARHIARGARSDLNEAEGNALFDASRAQIQKCWELAKEAFHCPIIQQKFLPILPTLIGDNEHHLPGSPATLIDRLNAWLPEAAKAAGVHILAIDKFAAQDGLSNWHDPGLWHRAKLEISLGAAPLYGDLVGRILAALRGRAYKCLVMDLDNTLWGGVVGDDGPEGIIIGQGSPLGEAFLDIQLYAREQMRRGVILAVCSKNAEENALAPFSERVDMILKRDEIAAFSANWGDKPNNIRQIASNLNIGLDSLVFVDDNPFERNLVRRELPMVAVPELPEDPALYVTCLAAAGYFDAVSVTDDDRARAAQYRENAAREQLKVSSTDLEGYLRDLDMRMIVRPFDESGLQRIVQLANKTNQFNLTTQRYTEPEILAFMRDPKAMGLQLRLVDRFGDNGIISLIMGRAEDDQFSIETWLMSCRVLGRTVEQATINIIADRALRAGASSVLGAYRPTAKNGMVAEHYDRLGFQRLDSRPDEHTYRLDLATFSPLSSPIAIVEE